MAGRKHSHLLPAMCAAICSQAVALPAFSDDAVAISASYKLTTNGYSLLCTGDNEAAVRTFTKAVMAQPGNLQARRLLARAQFNCGRMIECSQQLLILLAVEPN